MRKAWIFLAIFVFLIFVGIAWYISGLNRVVRMDEEASEAWAQIDTQLKRRSELIPDLVATVKRYVKHEREVFTHVADARSALAGARTVAEKLKAAKELDGALARLLAIVERYPDLKANQTFLRLMDELSGTTNRIAVARVRYNRAVKTFNAHIREVFGRFFAKRRGLAESRTYFVVEKEEAEIPGVEF
ncbi:MAG: LemA family protein [bacterium]